MSDWEIVVRQLSTDTVFVPIDVFQPIISDVLCRWVHIEELADREVLLEELMGDTENPTRRQIILQAIEVAKHMPERDVEGDEEVEFDDE